MTKQEKLNKEIVLRFNREVLEKGNINAIHEIVHPDFINHNLPPDAVQGPQSIINFTVDILHKALTDITVEILDQVVEGDKVVTRKTGYGTHVDTFMGIAPSNKKVAFKIIDIITLNNGQYMEHWSIMDIRDVIAKSTS
jgi:predicted ester cyclase